MSTINLDWKAIRPLNGSQHKGFEELCAQLARAEVPPGSRFIRKGTPDAGIECYAILADGSEWGWQSKYLNTLDDSQWSQISESVEKAIDKHPRLTRYFVCIPLDMPDGRIEGRKSAKQRWDEHTERWQKRASGQGMVVDFIYWGSHELLERLTPPQQVGRVRFWFDVKYFDDPWFRARLDETVRTAGPRYTPEIHVDLPIAAEFEAFGRTERFFDDLKAHARRVRQEIRSFEYHHPPTQGNAGLEETRRNLSDSAMTVLTKLAALEVVPAGALPFSQIEESVLAAQKAIDEETVALSEMEGKWRPDEDTRTASSAHANPSNPFRECRYRIYRLSNELAKLQEALKHANQVAGSSVLLLLGDGGTGKTHLLCDVARRRIAANQPTVLLLGQRFVSHDAPWVQALHQLDMAGLTAKEFVGALESAAQAADCRALVLVDALNEGAGSTIWPSHLAAFLAHLERSQWIGTVLSVRSSYESIVIPEAVRKQAFVLTHQGFIDNEFDATRTFFAYYGLELPSTPLLAPEFHNPLFLKSLCSGLKAKGHSTLPRGSQGITAVFQLHLSGVNDRLAKSLDFNPRLTLVDKALASISKAIVDSGERWVTLTEATEIIDALLPGRGFERSLYRGLVVEGVLVQEASSRNMAHEEVVFIAYERLADHLVARTLLDRHLDLADPAAAFHPGGGLAFLADDTKPIGLGLLEAMCIQIPERTGRELLALAPPFAEHWHMGRAFRQSVIWRALGAYSAETRQALNDLIMSEDDLHDTLDVLLTVATLPGHPLNADFLDNRLRQDTMPERDAWWSIYLHAAWGSHGAVDRLVAWASSVTPRDRLEDGALDLCSTALAWMLTTSNRFVRDRATTALVSLLTGRLTAVGRLLDRFSDVDDPYVVERVYAVAYATAIRSHDPQEVAALAERAYSHIFSTGAPPAHILLRDYARGVIERALHLGSEIHFDVAQVRPPYQSEWPAIPSEDEIKPFLSDWSRGSHDSGDLAWARNRIGSSVMDDDFAWYVIGTNSPSSSDWLSLRLDEPAWRKPKPPEDQLSKLVASFSPNERERWDAFIAAMVACRQAWREVDDGGAAPPGSEGLDIETEESDPTGDGETNPALQQAESELTAALTPEHLEALSAIFDAAGTDDVRYPPRFDLSEIQRYVLRRVFSLGWTTERFGAFDRFSIGYHGREAHKAERIGKKYQWIAYHEIMALIADHFQYREEFREADHQSYEGPWQSHLRDIDPSCTLRAAPGGTSWGGHSPAWWGSAVYGNWGEPENREAWARRWNDLPAVESLLMVSNPDDGSRWLNAQGYYLWQQRTPADVEPHELERREVWLMFYGYLMQSADRRSFLDWAEGVDFWGRWMPEPQEVYRLFLGEHGWAPASRYFQQEYYGDEGWTQPSHECPIRVRAVSFEYLREGSTFDCSVDEGYSLRLPAPELIRQMGLRWFGDGADFLEADGRLAVFDPTAHGPGPTALLFREDCLRQFLEREDLSIVWTVLGEKRILTPHGSGPRQPALRVSGAYGLEGRGPEGFLKCMFDDPGSEHSDSPLTVLHTIRSSV